MDDTNSHTNTLHAELSHHIDLERQQINSVSVPITDLKITDSELTDKVTTLCGTMAAMEYQFLSLLAEFDQRKAWAGTGTRSCAHWLNWRCGMNLGAARERVRVAHALKDLPRISDAFSKGHLSFSKVRAMTRIATPELEEHLMATAQYGSASHIEKLVRIYRRCESLEELSAERKACNQRHYTRSISHYWNDEGSLVIKACLPPEQGALVLKALEAAEESLKEDDQFDPEQGVTAHADNNKSASTSAHECDEDVSAETSLEEKTQHSYDRQIARRADALAVLARDWLNQDHSASKNADRYQVVVNVDADILANKIRPNSSEQACCIDDMVALPADTVQRLSCDCSVMGVIMKNQQPLSISRKSRSVPPAIRRAVVRRDHGCVFPGCCATKYVECHHIQHWANGGETSLENLMLVCSHHHHLLHEGDYTVSRNSEGRLDFFDPRGRYIDPVQAQPDDIEYRYHVHELQNYGIDEKTIWTYTGDRMDYDQVVDGLLFSRDKANSQSSAVLPQKRLTEGDSKNRPHS